jgi:hypothetical protein
MAKRLLGVLSVLLLCLLVNAQVTTEPAFIPKDYAGEIIVKFNPAEGNGGMVGATACYAHTGLITSKSASGTDWKYATPTWRGGEEKYKMTKEGDVWVLRIPELYSYYGCPETEEILKLAFVFNDGPNGSKEGKTADGSDIYIDLAEAGLNIKFTSPEANQLIEKGSTMDFTINTSEEATIVFSINDKSLTRQKGTELKYSYTFTETGNYTCIAKATTSNETKTDTVTICVISEPTNEARPEGLQEGITYYDNDPTKATLCLYSKNNKNQIAQNVFVLGDFNSWSFSTEYQMKKDGETGYFWLDITGLEPEKEYIFQYAVKRPDGSIIQISDPFTHKTVDPNDHYIPEDIYPNMLSYPAEADGPCAVIQTARKPYEWSDATLNFKRPNKNNLVIYELWVYDFCPTRSFEGVLDRLDYIENLGVNAIEFMPINEFENNISWGYNPTHYFALDKAYGTDDVFKKLVDECHKRGIAVIVDMVFNHATGWAAQNKMFPLAENPYFNLTPPHGDNVFEDWNHDFEGTRNHFHRVLKYWLEEYKIDGYRMDLAHGLCGKNCDNYGNQHILEDYYANSIKAVSEDAYFILEHWNRWGEQAALINKGMMCWDNTSHAYFELAMGWYNGSNSSALNNANRDNYVSYAESHDEERCGYKAMQYGNGDIKTDKATRLNRVAAYVAMSTMLNGPQMMWMWEELGYDVSITYKHTTDQYSSDYRTEPKPIPEGKGFYTDPMRMSQYQIIGQINQLRTRILPQVFEGNPTAQDLAHGRPIRSISWGEGVNRLFIVSNVSVDPQEIALPNGSNWYDYLANSTEMLIEGKKVTLKPGEVKVYTAQHFQLPEVPSEYVFGEWTDVENIEFKTNCTIYPTIAEDVVFIETSEDIKSVEVINIQGQKVISEAGVTSINVSSLPQGLYMVIVNCGNTQEAHKIYRK